MTSLELLTLQIPSTLLADTMVGSLFQHHQIDALVVGADRVVANGDTANKVGTYNAAVLAKRHGVKVVIVAPETTVDLNTPEGSLYVQPRLSYATIHISKLSQRLYRQLELSLTLYARTSSLKDPNRAATSTGAVHDLRQAPLGQRPGPVDRPEPGQLGLGPDHA